MKPKPVCLKHRAFLLVHRDVTQNQCAQALLVVFFCGFVLAGAGEKIAIVVIVFEVATFMAGWVGPAGFWGRRAPCNLYWGCGVGSSHGHLGYSHATGFGPHFWVHAALVWSVLGRHRAGQSGYTQVPVPGSAIGLGAGSSPTWPSAG